MTETLPGTEHSFFRRRGGMRGRALSTPEHPVAHSRDTRNVLTLPPEETRPTPAWRSGVFGVLDIGSTKMTCLIGRGEPDGSLNVLGYGWRRAHGIRSGSIVDVREAEAAIRATVGQAEDAAEKRMDALTVNLSGGHPASRWIDVHLPIGGREVTAHDVDQLRVDAKARAWAEGRSIIHNIPLGYLVDGMAGVTDPRGYQCTELSARFHIVDMHSSSLRTLDTVLQRAELRLDGLVSSPFASALSVLSDEERDLGVTVVEMGGGTTSLSVFLEGRLLHIAQIPVGGLHVTRDIASALSTSLDTAERLKTLFGAAQLGSDDQREMLSIPLIGESRDRLARVPRARLISFIEPRIAETLELVRNALDTSGLGGMANTRVVLTGGASLMEGLVPVASRILGRSVRLGRPLNIHGLPENDAASAGFSTVSGLLAWAAGADRNFAHTPITETAPNNLFQRLVGFIRDRG
ncbi:cell division protein FtsA [Neokomagataea thailandica NBRC 106555]|uniref:Cell division protein FtsA n=2 Tax=Neokomagataea TaxID=1223423 RepID=A0A4Y6V693_9PROT|nr:MULTISPECIES: cell division protein FtsA [Neokomagataea]QDH24131.1 cell division protein FtsA [Neokomagataea tanensis]GBR50469.1 cell division protein FtsA [Neokomagataea thailandica NBRC 106555]